MKAKHVEVVSEQPAAQVRPGLNTVRAAHHETPTMNSWEAFVAHRRAVYSAQLEALRRK